MSNRIYIIEQKDIFTVQEAARYLTVSTKTVYNLISTGVLKAFKIGNRYKITAESIAEYLDNTKNDINMHS